MMGDRILKVFTFICFCCSGGHGQKDTSIPCDDKRVENVVNLTLSKHNELLTVGTLLALYEIQEATKAQNESGEVLFVRFTSRETDCPAGGDKVWQQCDYLQQADKVLRNCHAKVLFTETGHELVLHDCSAEPSIISEKARCLGCPENIDIYKEELREPLIHSLARANSMTNHMHLFLFKSLSSATKQVVAGFRYKLQFDMEKSNCTKSEFKAVTEECHAVQEEREFMQCNSTVDVAPWRHESPEVHTECAAGARMGGSRIKRPPGWSPLRSMPSKPPSPKPIEKPEEESKEIMSITQRTPLNCPSKPWKEFKPFNDSPSSLNTTASAQPNSTTADAQLSDLDLLS
ncbi:kininogen-like [Xyrauchen texanus]|uniref:kininogen-like n=1 Tax=Xyrauchen texanus TaxID=154827 RepID=UPI0022428909|nr:kininogen-like [Xyrauchen texanus]